MMHKYGITIEEYKELYDLQKGLCAICGKPLNFMSVPAREKTAVHFGRPEVDHVHLVKKEASKVSKKSTVRGILCGGRWAGCNAKLGKVDNVKWLTAAAQYIANPPAQRLFKESVK